jgi:hypothetical protein
MRESEGELPTLAGSSCSSLGQGPGYLQNRHHTHPRLTAGPTESFCPKSSGSPVRSNVKPACSPCWSSDWTFASSA